MSTAQVAQVGYEISEDLKVRPAVGGGHFSGIINTLLRSAGCAGCMKTQASFSELVESIISKDNVVPRSCFGSRGIASSEIAGLSWINLPWMSNGRAQPERGVVGQRRPSGRLRLEVGLQSVLLGLSFGFKAKRTQEAQRALGGWEGDGQSKHSSC